MALLVLYKSQYISYLPNAKQQREMTKYSVFWRTLTTTEVVVGIAVVVVLIP